MQQMDEQLTEGIAMSIDELLRREFPVEETSHYLNHAAVAPWPQRTADAVRAFADECVRAGAAGYPHWLTIETRLRNQFAQLVGAHADDIALVKNTSEGLSFVAQGFPWHEGDNVVSAASEFPSNRIVWEALSERGVSARLVDIENANAPEEALLAAADRRTRLISVSSVQYASGLRLDLGRLGSLCRRRGIALCVDAIQGLGVYAHDVKGMQIDFLVADGHKWLLGPEGIGLFYCSPTWRDRLRLQEFGWRMTEDPTDFARRSWRPAGSARRFECGSPNMLGIHALSASLSLLAEIGIDTIEQRVLERADQLFDLIDAHPELVLLTRREPGRYAGIVSFRHRKRPAEELYRYFSEGKVVCAQRGQGLRLSPHCYNDVTALMPLFTALG